MAAASWVVERSAVSRIFVQSCRGCGSFGIEREVVDGSSDREVHSNRPMTGMKSPVSMYIRRSMGKIYGALFRMFVRNVTLGPTRDRKRNGLSQGGEVNNFEAVNECMP